MITPGRGTTEVDLVAQLESRSVAVRALMLLGGRRRLRRHLDALEPAPAAATPSHH
jgi:hypothetical protein